MIPMIELQSNILSYLDRISSTKFSIEVFNTCGFFIVKSSFEKDEVMSWQKIWFDFYQDKSRNVNQFNPVEVLEDLPHSLMNISKHQKILDVIEQIVGKDIGLFRTRFVVKDEYSRKHKVPLHEDFSYQVGWPNKSSVFLALSTCSEKNGGLTLYPGTHKFGYLGDAGEINKDVLGDSWPSLTPTLLPGDFIVMNSSTWHESKPNISGLDRISTDFIYQSANDFSTKEVVRGDVVLSKNFMNSEKDGTPISPHERTIKLSDRFFINSRSSKLKKLYDQLDSM